MFTRFLPCFENIAAEPFIHQCCIIAIQKIVWNWFLWNFLTSRLSPITEILFSPIIASFSVVWNDSLHSRIKFNLSCWVSESSRTCEGLLFFFFSLVIMKNDVALHKEIPNFLCPLPSITVQKAKGNTITRSCFFFSCKKNGQ